MSLDITVYCNSISENLVPKILERLNDFDMNVEIHPNFKFDQKNDTGFLPFKFRFKEPKFEILQNKDLVSGFEIYISDFDLVEEKKQLTPKLTFFNKLLGKKSLLSEFAPAKIETKLANCKKSISFVWHSSDSFELRFASLTSAILTEITNGVCCYPADDIWYENENIIEEAFKEIKEYESSMSESDLQFHEFKSW